MIKKYGDIVPAVFTLILSVFFFVMSLNIDVMDKYGGSALVPQICAGLIALCSLALICQGIFKKYVNSGNPNQRGDAGLENTAESPSNYKVLVLTLASITCYAALFGVLGFILSTVLYLFIQILLLNPKMNLKAIIIAAVTALIVTVLVYQLFFNVFYIVLPAGSIWYSIF